MKKAKKMRAVRAWAWAFQQFTAFGIREGDWCLCYWAEPSKAALTARSKPTPDAIPVRVEIREIRPVRRGKRVRRGK